MHELSSLCKDCFSQVSSRSRRYGKFAGTGGHYCGLCQASEPETVGLEPSSCRSPRAQNPRGRKRLDLLEMNGNAAAATAFSRCHLQLKKSQSGSARLDQSLEDRPWRDRRLRYGYVTYTLERYVLHAILKSTSNQNSHALRARSTTLPLLNMSPSPATILAPIISAISLYAAQKSYIAITNLLRYEERSERAAKHSETAAHQLWKTRATQGSSAGAVGSYLPFVLRPLRSSHFFTRGIVGYAFRRWSER